MSSRESLRTFKTGATRDTDEGKYDYEAFFSPLVLEHRAAYMHQHRIQADGGLRDGDNWQAGIPLSAYIKSMWRHFYDLWRLHRGYKTPVTKTEALCAIMFNAEGYLHELLKQEIEDGKHKSEVSEDPDCGCK